MKKRFLIVLAGICFLPSLAICQVIEWQNTIGGSLDDQITSIEQTADGGYILGGYSLSNISGDKTEICNGGKDYWIVKTDAAGAIQWQNTIGGNANDILTSIHQTFDGGYILGGMSRSNISGDKTENTNGVDDYWIVKTDASGNIQWQNTIGGSDNDLLNSIQQTADGGYILGGTSSSSISGDKTENNNGINDYWIVKTDASGNIQWQNTIGGSVHDDLYSIKQTADGGYILGGFSISSISGDKIENSLGGPDYWIVKTDASGTIQWQNTIGGSNADILQSIEQTVEGGYILAGDSQSNISGDKTENGNGWEDYWIVKTDASGVIQWQNTIGGSSGDRPYSIHQIDDFGYILGGVSDSDISGDKTENSIGGSDYWIVKTDASGNVQWQNTIGGSGNDGLFSIAQTTDGGYIMGGQSESGISGDKTENCNGGWDYWIVKFSDQYNLITGKLFIDANSNNTQDAGELPVVNKKVLEVNTGMFGFSGQNGNYYISVQSTGVFSVSPNALNYYNAAPITQSASFTGTQQTDNFNDFAFQPSGILNDLCVTITPLGPFRAGFNASYRIDYENVGNTTLNPTVIFIPDDDVNFVSATPSANTVTPDSVLWNFGPLTPFQTGSILVTVNVNIGTPIGTLINSGARIEPIVDDANTACNYSYWEVLTTGSFDPNDIIVNEDSLLTTQFPNPPYLEYIIRFQNTGNDTAFTVNILTPINTLMLDLNSLEFVSASHPVALSWIPWKKNMEFRFENILLPDSNVNEQASHGFVRYRIKPKSWLILDNIITSQAAIYFDFNAPVITNTAVTRIVLSPTIPTPADNLVIYPNPAYSTINIVSGILSSPECRLIISDVSGRILFSKSIATATSKHNIDISSFSQGIYFVQLQAGDRNSRRRFVKW